MSDLQTVFYSTVYECPVTNDEKFLAQGKSILISHIDGEGVSRKATGYWGSEAYRALDSRDDCPEWLRRDQKGTSIYALGFREMDQWQYRIAASLVRNFFVAIHRGEMEFSVNDGELRLTTSYCQIWCSGPESSGDLI